MRASSSRFGARRAFDSLIGRHLDRLALAAGPPVDRVARDARRLLRQVEGAHGGHAASLRLGVERDPRVQVHQRPGGILDRQLAELDRLGEDDLLLGGEERDLADLLEVHADRVVDADEVGGERLEILLALLGLRSGLGGGGRRRRLVLLLVGLTDEGRLVRLVEDLDAGLLGRRVELLEGAHLGLG